jgi:hypothetical protein
VGEEGKESTKETTDEGIDRNGRVGIETVAVNQVGHALPEGNHGSDANERCGNDRGNPGDAWI